MSKRLIERTVSLEIKLKQQAILFRLKGAGVTEENVDTILAELLREQKLLEKQIKEFLS